MRRIAVMISLVLALMVVQPGPIIASTDNHAIEISEVLALDLLVMTSVLLRDVGKLNENMTQDLLSTTMGGGAVSISERDVVESVNMGSMGALLANADRFHQPIIDRLGYDVLKYPI